MGLFQVFWTQAKRPKCLVEVTMMCHVLHPVTCVSPTFVTVGTEENPYCRGLGDHSTPSRTIDSGAGYGGCDSRSSLGDFLVNRLMGVDNYRGICVSDANGHTSSHRSEAGSVVDGKYFSSLRIRGRRFPHLWPPPMIWTSCGDAW